MREMGGGWGSYTSEVGLEKSERRGYGSSMDGARAMREVTILEGG